MGGFAADVLEQEPQTANELLLQLENVLVTAYLGSMTCTTYSKMCTVTVENTFAILAGEQPMEYYIYNRNELSIN